MKKLGKIKLNQLNEVDVNEKEMNRLIGGRNCCTCGCNTSPSTDNNLANYDGNLVSPSGGTQHGALG